MNDNDPAGVIAAGTERLAAAQERANDIAWLAYIAELPPSAVSPGMSKQAAENRARIIASYAPAEPTRTVGSIQATMERRTLAALIGIAATGRMPHVTESGDVIVNYEDMHRVADAVDIEIWDHPERMRLAVRMIR